MVTLEIRINGTLVGTAGSPEMGRRAMGTKVKQEREIFEHARSTYLRLREKYEGTESGA
jgi:hypothetical protein